MRLDDFLASLRDRDTTELMSFLFSGDDGGEPYPTGLYIYVAADCDGGNYEVTRLMKIARAALRDEINRRIPKVAR